MARPSTSGPAAYRVAQVVDAAALEPAYSKFTGEFAARCAAEDLLFIAAGLIAELLSSPCDEILDHSARTFLDQFDLAPTPPPPCGPSDSSASSQDSSPASPSPSS